MLKEYYTQSPSSTSLQDDRNGNYPIHIAAQNGFTEHVQLLLDHGVDVDSVNSKGNTPLHMALSYDYIETAELLMEKGANVHLANDSGFTAATGLEGDKSRGIVYLLAANTTEEINRAFDIIASAPEDTEKGNFVSKCMAVKKKLTKDNEGVWTSECDARMKDVLSKLS